MSAIGVMAMPADFRYRDVFLKGKPQHDRYDLFRIKHPRMATGRRAKIFSPFDALKGFSEAVKESMKTGPYVLILTYFFLTVAELFISPLGLSFVSKIAPKHLQGICQGLWLTSTAVGNLFIALGVTMLNQFPQQWMCWAVFAGFCLLSMTVMLSMVKWLERVTAS